jgi:hypothetical protein
MNNRATSLSPADKLRRIATKLGVPNLVNQQATTVAAYDTLDLAALSTAATTTLSFFNDLNTRTFPDTNLSSNVFNAGQCLLVQYLSFAIVSKAAGVVTDIQPIEDSTLKALLAGDFSLLITGSEVIKQNPVSLGYAPFNPNAEFYAIQRAADNATPAVFTKSEGGHSVILNDTDLAITPNREFTLSVRCPRVAAVPTAGTRFLRAQITGYGTLPAIQGTL